MTVFAPYLVALGSLLVLLRAHDVIGWPWFWVLFPLWLPFVFAIGLVAVATVYGLLDDEGES